MAAKKKDNPIALRLKEYENKIDEFQEYLKNTKIKNISDYSERHDEIKVQVLLMKELGPMLQQLKALLVVEESKQEESIRGDLELSPLESGMI